MGYVTGEFIKSAIARNIKQNIKLADNASFKIYKEKIVQNMAKPCFFVWAMDVEQTKLMQNIYTRSYQMNVRFHIDENSPRQYEQLSDVGNKLLESLAVLQLPIQVIDQSGGIKEETKPVIGKQMSYNIVDNVLQMYVTYTIRMKKELDEKPVIQQLEIEII